MTPSEVLFAAGSVQFIIGAATLIDSLLRTPDVWPKDPDWPQRASIALGFWFSGLTLLVSALLVALASGTQL